MKKATAAKNGNPKPLLVQEQGSFAVGGTVIRNPGTFDSIKRTPEGQTLHGDHAYVFYQIPVDARKYPLVFLHGATQFSKTWESTPDGREGFQNIFLRRGFGVYLIDQPRRGDEQECNPGISGLLYRREQWNRAERSEHAESEQQRAPPNAIGQRAIGRLQAHCKDQRSGADPGRLRIGEADGELQELLHVSRVDIKGERAAHRQTYDDSSPARMLDESAERVLFFGSGALEGLGFL